MEIKIKNKETSLAAPRIGSTLFYGRLWIWPIVMIVRINGSCRKNIDNFVLKYNNTDRKED